ncbi:hypothetical protein RD110_08065 [Rhodoferax koreense]|uniref:Uncharacterized protein n=1 Tax=Rhodoferax koreensis TaxID=1842727 RepID=A0A1P8JTV5_9BURK|nr:hypothetical protein [Rhodoferax koreense]APW37158.1 hypothetical protein RD110_08065 [Rhodoferax koreense]
MPTYVIQKDSKTAVPLTITQAQADAYALKFPVYLVNADNSRTFYAGPTAPANIATLPNLGVKNASEIADLNAQLAAGTLTYPPGTWLTLASSGTDAGTVYRLKGVGTAATFSVEGGGSGGGSTTVGTDVSSARSFASSDSGSIVPLVNPDLVMTIPLGLAGATLNSLFSCVVALNGTPGFTFPSGVTVNGVAGPSTLYRAASAGVMVSLTQIAANKFLLNGVDASAPTDADMTAFNARVTAASGTTSSGTKAAVQAFITGLKADGLWTLLDDIWVPVGDFAASPVKIKNATNAIFVGIVSGDYAENLGVKGDGTTAKYVRRQYNPKHIGSFYQYLRTTQAGSTTLRCGLGVAETNHFTLGYNTNAVGTGSSTSIRGKAGGAFSTSSPAAFNGNAAGGYGVIRRSNTDAELTFNATSLNTSATSTTGADCTLEAFELLRNANGTPDQVLDANSYTGGSAYFNTGVTQAQMFAFHARMQTLQTALSRNV